MSLIPGRSFFDNIQVDSWKWLTGGKNVDAAKNLLVLVTGALTIMSSPFWSNVIPHDRSPVKLYAASWDRLQVAGARTSTTHLKDVQIDLWYQVQYILVNGGQAPIEPASYVEPVAVEGVDGATVLSVSSKPFEIENGRQVDRGQVAQWTSEDGLTWKMPPTFLNPGDRQVVTLSVGARPKKDWMERDIYGGLRFSGKFRGSNLQIVQEMGKGITSAYVAWFLCGISASYAESAAYVYLFFVFVFFFCFMWFLLPRLAGLKSRGAQICGTFVCIFLSLAAADGSYSILFPSHLWGDTSRLFINWASAFGPILAVAIACISLPGQKKATRARSTRNAG